MSSVLLLPVDVLPVDILPVSRVRRDDEAFLFRRMDWIIERRVSLTALCYFRIAELTSRGLRGDLVFLAVDFDQSTFDRGGRLSARHDMHGLHCRLRSASQFEG